MDALEGWIHPYALRNSIFHTYSYRVAAEAEILYRDEITT